MNLNGESVIDERYRLMLLEHYFDGVVEVPLVGGGCKFQFICPFCGALGRTEGRKRHRKAALLWNPVQHSWVFCCSKKGSVECQKGKTLGNLIGALNPDLGEAYKVARWHSGTTGKGHNCGAPKSVAGIGTFWIANASEIKPD